MGLRIFVKALIYVVHLDNEVLQFLTKIINVKTLVFLWKAQKSFLFLVARPFPLPLFVAGKQGGELFLRLPLLRLIVFICFSHCL